MNAFEFNKIAGAVLAALLVIFGTRTLMHEIRHNSHAETQGYVVEIASTDATATGGATEPAAGPSFTEAYASADTGKGEKLFKKCSACHAKEAGAGKRVGPNLHGIVDRGIAAADGFKYSAALASKGGNWSAEELDAFLTSPKAYAKGTKMAFAGIKKVKQRADLIKFLATLK